jgi:hypothetical protein
MPAMRPSVAHPEAIDDVLRGDTPYAAASLFFATRNSVEIIKVQTPQAQVS